MQKTLLAIALATAFSAGSVQATDLTNNDNQTATLVGEYTVAADQKVVIKSSNNIVNIGDNSKIELGENSSLHIIHKDPAGNNDLVLADTGTSFNLGRNGALTLESQSTGYTLSGMLRGNVTVTGGDDSVLNILQTGSANEAALADSHHPSVLKLQAGTINIEAKSDRTILRQNPSESLIIDAKTINIKGRVQQGGNGKTTIKGFNTLTIDGRTREALRIAAGNLTVNGGTTGAVVLKNAAENDAVIDGNSGSNGTIDLTAGNVTVTGSTNTAISMGKGTGLNLKADYLNVSAKTAINVANGATVNLGSASEGTEQTAVLKGDITVADGGTAAISLNNSQSSLTGAALISGANASLGLKDGAKWSVTGDSAVSNMLLDKGTVDLSGSDGSIKVDNLQGSGGKVVMDAKGTNTFEVANETTSKLKVVATENADCVTAGEAKAMYDRVQGQVANKDVFVEEGNYNGALIVDGNGNVTEKVNTLMEDASTLGGNSLLSLNRIVMNDVRKRMGDVRSAEGATGVWARYDGGRLTADGFVNKFNTIQVGADTLVPNTNTRIGMAASYTKGDNDFRRGSADLDAYMLTGYGMWLADNGMFADVVARLAKAENEMTVDGGTKTGKLENLAYSLSGEFGWRFDLSKEFYVEPQAELTYTYVDSDDLDLGVAKYKLDSMTSFLGRVGVSAGLKCPNNKGDLYLRVSAVHEFDGDSKITGATGKTFVHDGKDTWVEYGIGGNFNLTPNTYVWADVERTSGAALDTDWRATVGVRYAF